MTRKRRRVPCKFSVATLTVILALALQNLPAGDWPQFRGPDGLGISDETGLAVEWGPDRNLLWKTPIAGAGHSSPAVWGDRIFLTAAVEGEALEAPTAPPHLLEGEEFSHPDWEGSDRSWTLKVIALDLSDGSVLWERTAYEGPVYDHRHRKNTYASATPLTDGKYVYAYFGSEGLYCYDFQGRLAWKRSLGGIGTAGMGNGTSPVLYRDKVIVLADQEFDGTKSFMTALDKDTGAEVWRVARQARVTWATPLLIDSSWRAELVVPGAENSIAYDPATGRELWRVKGLVSHAIPSPVSDGETVFLSAGSQDKHTMAVRLGGSGELTGGDHVLWEYDKGSAYVPSPILYRGMLYLLSDKGVVTCLDGATGEVLYTERTTDTTVKASPVALDGKVMITDEAGCTFVVQAGTEFRTLAKNCLEEPVWASPAISRGVILIRGRDHLFAIAEK